MAAPIRLGTCSWADQGLIETWYPSTARSSEARLRYYAERYDTVEVNSSYYAIPEAGTATKWAERTPDGFVFHVKAFGMMTGHRVTPEQLPADLRPLVSQMTSRGHVDPSQALLERVFRRFKQALDPLASADRMGGVLMQYGPGLTPSDASREFIEMGAELLAPYPVLVEFRQRDWLSEEHVESTLEFLRARNLSHVIVDAPHVSTPNIAQTVIAATNGTAYVRYHGRNAATWNVTGGVACGPFRPLLHGAGAVRLGRAAGRPGRRRRPHLRDVQHQQRRPGPRQRRPPARPAARRRGTRDGATRAGPG